MEQNSKLTVYTMTVKTLSLYILEAVKAYERFSAFNLSRLENRIRASRLKELLKKDINILKYKNSTILYIDREINESFSALSNWLKTFYEISNSGQIFEESSLCILDQYINNCYCSLMYVFICTSEDKMEKFNEKNVKNGICKEIYSNGFMKAVRILICREINDTANYVTNLNIFLDQFNPYLYSFLEGKINSIFMSEIRNSFVGRNNINGISNLRFTFDNVEYMISYIYSEFGSFIARNYLYSVIEQSLIDNGTTYGLLQSDYIPNPTMPLFSITITCGSQSYVDKEYLVTRKGIEGSIRHASDCLITLGRESREEFINDITLPDINETDSIFGVIFINSLGLNLIDISKEYIIWMKLEEEKEYKLKKGIYLRFGKSTEFEIDFGTGLLIGGKSEIINIISLGTTNKIISINQGYNQEKIFKIGTGTNCDMKLEDSECNELHAEIFYNTSDKNYYIRDKQSKKGTFRRLKKKNQILSKKPSSLITLENGQVFFVQNYGFLIQRL